MDLYGFDPSEIRIGHTNAGRALFAEKAFNPGDVIFKTNYYVTALNSSCLSTNCTRCNYLQSYKPEDFMSCPYCKRVKFCSKSCFNIGMDSPSVHRQECKVLSSLPDRVTAMPFTSLRAMGKMIWSKEEFGDKWWKQVEAMYADSDPPEKEKEKCLMLAQALTQYVGQDMVVKAFGSGAKLANFCYAFSLNTFTLTAKDLDDAGAVTCPSLALINHSCSPNVNICFPTNSIKPGLEQSFQLVAMKKIKPGDELLCSYVDLTLPTAIRKEKLKEQYNFDCKCKKCSKFEKDGGKSDPRQLANCHVENCTGTVVVKTSKDNTSDSTAQTCSGEQSHPSMYDPKEVDKILEQVEDFISNKSTIQKDGVQKTLNWLNHPYIKHLHDAAHPKLELLFAMEFALIEELGQQSHDILGQIVTVAMRILTALQSILTKNDPAIACHCARLCAFLYASLRLDAFSSDPSKASSMLSDQRWRSNVQFTSDFHKQTLERLNSAYGKPNEGGPWAVDVRNYLTQLEGVLATIEQFKK